MLTQPCGCFLFAPVGAIIDRGARHHRGLWGSHTLKATGASRRTRRWRAATTRWWRAPRSRIAPLPQREQPHGCVSIKQLDSALARLSASLGVDQVSHQWLSFLIYKHARVGGCACELLCVSRSCEVPVSPSLQVQVRVDTGSTG